MDKQTVRTVWLACGAALFYFSINAWLASTGADFHLPGIELPKFKKALIYGTFAIPLAYFVLWLSDKYAHLSVAEVPTLRVPSILERGLDQGPGLVVRWLVFAGFVLLPVVAQIHFLYQIATDKIYATKGALAASGTHEMLTKALPLCRDCWRFGDPNGLEFFPLVQPWLLVGAVLGLLGYLLLVLFHVSRK